MSKVFWPFKVFCRVFQFIMKIAAYALPWRKPFLLEGENCVLRLPGRILERGIKSVLIVTDKGIMSLGLPDALLGARYYEPTEYGHEKAIKERLDRLRGNSSAR